MIAVPFIYFSIIAFVHYKKNKGVIDIGLLIALMYAISGFFSILYYKFGLNNVNYTISLLPTVVYCSLLSLNLYPFLRFSHNRVYKILPLDKDKPLKTLSWVVFLWFAMSVALSYKDVVAVLTGDLKALRAAVYAGENDLGFLNTLPAPLRLVVVILNMCFGMPWVLILLAFYSFYIQKLSPKYLIFFLLASLSGPIRGVLSADRSASAYWMISLLFVYVFFLPYIPKKQRKYINIFLLIIVIALGLYLSLMTVARFEDSIAYVSSSIDGTLGSMIAYLGMSFPNFCYFLEDFTPAFTNLNLIFPSTAQYIFGSELVGGVNLQEEMTMKTGVATGTFYTYLGQIRVFCGIFVMFLFSLVYSISSYAQLKKRTRFATFSLKSVFVYLFLSSFMSLGLFAYPYSSPTKTISIVFSLIYINIFLRKVKTK